MGFIKYIIFIHLFLPALVFSAESKKTCSSNFLNPSKKPRKHFTQEFIKNFFSDPKNLEKYKGQEGFVHFMKEYFNSWSMHNVLAHIQLALPKDKIKVLAWKSFQGSTSQLEALFNFVDSHSVEDIKGPEGQKKAARIFDDHLKKIYLNVSAYQDYLFKNKNVFQALRDSGWSSTLTP